MSPLVESQSLSECLTKGWELKVYLEAILATRLNHTGQKVLVKWTDLPDFENSWELDLDSCDAQENKVTKINMYFIVMEKRYVILFSLIKIN